MGNAVNDEALEGRYFDECRAIDNASKYSYARVGIICREVKELLLWQKRTDPATGQPCASFSKWVKLACPWSYATSQAAMRDVEELRDVPEEHLKAIPASNFPIIKQLSTGVRADPVVLEAAKTKQTVDFVEHIREHHPEQHLERKVLMRFTPDESACEIIEKALKMAQGRGATNRNQALELIAIEAMESWRLEDEVDAIIAAAPEVAHEPDS